MLQKKAPSPVLTFSVLLLSVMSATLMNCNARKICIYVDANSCQCRKGLMSYKHFRYRLYHTVRTLNSDLLNTSEVSNKSTWRCANFSFYYIKLQDLGDFWPLFDSKHIGVVLRLLDTSEYIHFYICMYV